MVRASFTNHISLSLSLYIYTFCIRVKYGETSRAGSFAGKDSATEASPILNPENGDVFTRNTGHAKKSPSQFGKKRGSP